MDWKEQYRTAHENWFKQQYPQAYKAGHYYKVPLPPVNKANGLTQFIVKFLTYTGWRATRVSSAGRYVQTANKWERGGWIPSTTRKGTADISATIKGRSVMIEIKVGKDRPSEHQLKEQDRERRAGGMYEFISTPEQFINLYYSIINT